MVPDIEHPGCATQAQTNKPTATLVAARTRIAVEFTPDWIMMYFAYSQDRPLPAHRIPGNGQLRSITAIPQARQAASDSTAEPGRPVYPLKVPA